MKIIRINKLNLIPHAGYNNIFGALDKNSTFVRSLQEPADCINKMLLYF
jgi:hypothetical protein